MKQSIRAFFGLTHTKDKADLDSPETTTLHRDIIQRKPFLKKIYLDHYHYFKTATNNVPEGIKIELGSGGGFYKEVMPEVITSDVLPLPYVDQVFSALDMPFADQSVSAIYMIDVLHHIPDVEKFFTEADRCLKPGGKIVMIEPTNTWWGGFIYRNFHHEPFDPTVREWKLPAGGPMSVANDAIPWIVFVRDRLRFQKLFPRLEITTVQYTEPVRYLLSGGVSMRQLVPNSWYGAVKFFEETILKPIAPWVGMFMCVEITKQPKP